MRTSHDEESEQVQQTGISANVGMSPPGAAGELSDPGIRSDGHDNRLVSAVRAGDVTAFATLFDTYHGPITGYLHRLTGDRDAADDLAQETFIKAFRALPRADNDIHFRPWLYRIATNTANSWHRRRRLITWIPFSFGSGDDTAEEPESDARLDELAGEREQVHAALQTIGPANASILLLRHHQRLTLFETAEALGVSPNTAKVRLFRARKAFVAAYQSLDVSSMTTDSRGRTQR